jgi:RimJ/RimL family protein N-acetyltransferase
MSAIPTIETDRLILRGQTLADFEASAALWADPDVARHIGGRPSTRDESWGRFQRNIGHWALMGYGLWAVIEKAGGDYIGEIGMADFKRPIDPPLPNVPEFGWVLAPRAWGKGYASEAVAAAIDWSQDHFGPTPLVCIIAPANTASLKVAERAGFVETRRAPYHDAETVVLERAAPR